jgi:hypothetical protein
MEKYMDVMKRTVELSESCLGAINHIKVRLNEGAAFEDSIRLMDDLVNGFYQIEKSLQGFITKLPLNQIEGLTNRLRSAMEHTVSAYEQGESGKVLEIIQFNLLPSFKSWRAELDQVLSPYLIS